MKAYGACDPAKLEELKRAITLAKEAAFRWTGMLHACLIISIERDPSPLTDNFGVLLGYFMRQYNIPSEDIRRYLEIGEDYEDLE